MGKGRGGNSGLGEAVLVKLLKELKAALGHAGGAEWCSLWELPGVTRLAPWQQKVLVAKARSAAPGRTPFSKYF